MDPTSIHDTTAHEAGVLAAAMYSAKSLHVTQRIISGKDFTDAARGKLYDLMVALEAAGRPVGNERLLVDSVREYGLTPRPDHWVRWLADNPLADVYAEHHAQAIRRAADLRAIISLTTDARKQAEDAAADPAAIAGWLSNRLDSMGRDRSRGAITAPEAVELALSRHKQESLAGYGTGIRALDDALGALGAEQLIILAARPTQGKSSLALQIACDIAQSGNLVLFVSIEMTEAEQAERLLARQLGEPVKPGAHTVDYTQRLRGVANEAAPQSLLVWKCRKPTLRDIRAEAKLHHARRPLSLLVVDYLQLMRGVGPQESREREVAEISRGLKELAGELGCPVLALSQLNREAEGQRPTMKMLRESGAIEQDADSIVFIFREQGSDSAELIVEKRRGGEGNKVADVLWDGPTTTFRDRAARDMPNYIHDFDDFNR